MKTNVKVKDDTQSLQSCVMSSSLFRFFIRKNYKELELSNEDIDSIGIDFMEYLNTNLSNEILERIMPKSEIDVIMNTDNLLLESGFHPALVIHFMNFVKFHAEAHEG